MSRKVAIGFGCIVLAAVSAGVFVWLSQERLTFSPEPGTSRTFVISSETHLEPQKGGRYARAETLTISNVLNTRVEKVDDGAASLNTSVVHALMGNGRRVLFDTDDINPDDERENLIARLMRAGLNEVVDERGQLQEFSFADMDAFSELSESAPEAIGELGKAMGLAGLYQPEFPTGTLRKGLSWQSEPLEGGAVELPAMHYEVVALSPERITVTLRESGVADEEPGSLGFLVFERATGWPLQGRLLVRQSQSHGDQTYEVTSYLSMYQQGHPMKVTDQVLEGWAINALNGFPVDLDDPDMRRYMVPPFVTDALDERLARLQDTMLWFPPGPGGRDSGLQLAHEVMMDSFVELTSLHGVSLWDQDDNPIKPGIEVNPRFRPGAMAGLGTEEPRDRNPFQVGQLSAQELEAIDRLELDLALSVPGELVSFEIDRSGGVIAGDAGVYQAEVLDWTDEQARVKLTHADDGAFDRWSQISALPQGSDGEPITHFGYRRSISVLEPLRSDFLEATDRDSDFMEFTRFIRPELHPLGDEWVGSDRIIEVRTREPISSLMVHVLPMKPHREVFSVQSAGKTLKGGPVVGTRVLDEYKVPTFEFAEIDMDSVSAEGAGNNRLSVQMPDQGGNRCSVRLLSPLEHQGRPLSLRSAGGYGHSEKVLSTDHGVRFFYDMQVSLQAQCLTRIDVRTEPVDDSEFLQRVDPFTIEISEQLYNDIDRVQAMRSGSYFGEQYPLIGRNGDQQPLVILSRMDQYQGEEAAPDSRRIRFWGEVEEVTFPVLAGKESRQIDIEFPPLP